ncbi:hypothetical protein EDB19DRAFT_1908590 [Suillus lakei]|nr:hypothetical protein EDB19DRAFT_1908590 [Suillus lakei]
MTRLVPTNVRFSDDGGTVHKDDRSEPQPQKEHALGSTLRPLILVTNYQAKSTIAHHPLPEPAYSMDASARTEASNSGYEARYRTTQEPSSHYYSTPTAHDQSIMRRATQQPLFTVLYDLELYSQVFQSRLRAHAHTYAQHIFDIRSPTTNPDDGLLLSPTTQSRRHTDRHSSLPPTRRHSMATATIAHAYQGGFHFLL